MQIKLLMRIKKYISQSFCHACAKTTDDGFKKIRKNYKIFNKCLTCKCYVFISFSHYRKFHSDPLKKSGQTIIE